MPEYGPCAKALRETCTVRPCASAGQKTRKAGRCEARQADAVVHSGVLESREIPHPAKVDQRAWAATGGQLARRAVLLQRRGPRHNCQRHAVSKNWTNILGPKTWGTCSEVTSRTAVSAWQWLHVGRLDLAALAAAQGRPSPKLCGTSCLMSSEYLIILLIISATEGT